MAGNLLVRQALASNTDLRVAAANLSRARAQVEQAQSAGGWSGSAKAGAQRLQESGEAFLLADKVLTVARAAGVALMQDPTWSRDFARAASAALAKPIVRVDVPGMAVTF